MIETGNSKERELMKSKNLQGKSSGELKATACFGSDESDHQEQQFTLKPSPDQFGVSGGSSGRPMYAAMESDFAAKYSRPKSSEHAGSSESPCHSSYSSHSSSCSASSRPSPSSPLLAKLQAHGGNNYAEHKPSQDEYEEEEREFGEEEDEYEGQDCGQHGINNTTASTINPNDLSDSDDECAEHVEAGEEPVDKQEDVAFLAPSDQPDHDSNA